jgi:hypothetical protein
MRGLSAKCWEMGFSSYYFVEEKPMDQVHELVDRAGPVHHGPVAITARGSSPELVLRPLRCPGAPTKGRGEEKGSTGVPVTGEPGLKRRWSGGATTVKAAVEERSARAHSGTRERGRRGGGGAVRRADAGAPFYRVGGGAWQPGVGEERSMVVVRHNGDEGGYFGRGLVGVVVGSDEGGGCSGRYGRKTTRRGPACQPVTERGEDGARSGASLLRRW